MRDSVQLEHEIALGKIAPSLSTVIICRVNGTRCFERISRDDRFLHSIVPHWVILRMICNFSAKKPKQQGTPLPIFLRRLAETLAHGGVLKLRLLPYGLLELLQLI